MTQAARYRFGDFVLDTASRSLLRDGVPVALNARYFDALVLLVREHGRLVGKQRFFDEVWAGSVVTDAALTQCIKEIRRALGDDASDPRFVRTVSGHGYGFIAAVSEGDGATDNVAKSADAAATGRTASPRGEAAGCIPAGAIATADADPNMPAGALSNAATVGVDAYDLAVPQRPPLTLTSTASTLPHWLVDGAAATVGGAIAGLVGGLLYGSAIAFSPQSQGLGSLSVLLVLVALSMLVGMAGALGVGLGLAGGHALRRGAGPILAGAALGGLIIGGLVKLLGSDAFTLLVGRAPTGITGGLEGAVLGFAVAAGLLLGGGSEAPRARRPAAFAALTTGLAGALIPLAGGSLMATSLARVAAAFDDSRLDMAPLGRLFGEPQFGPVAEAALGALEGGVFGGCVVAALVVARRYVVHR
ncbi:MAG TPA: transcriptional regulator [Vicinamibacterales bacterium]|nr:transcriptional regulator [Vicinamibacterales bacterium]